ncbi:MAG TPA: TolC family protein, partial [Bryobacteraceae bacterium]|nr:TolC family protein [Bryobacteraceae bacterium]
MTIVLLLPIMLAAEPWATQAAETVLPLSLKRAVEIALTPEGNPRIALAEETIKLAEAQARESKAGLLPDFESSVNDRRQTTNLRAFGFNFAIPIPGLVIPQIVGPFSVFDARATASQTVFDWSAIEHYRASKQNIESVKADFDASRNQVRDQVARAYVQALRAATAYDTAQANVDLSNALLKQAGQEKEAGTGTGIEVVRAEVQLANDQQRLVVAANDRRKMILNLMRAMGLKLDTRVELTDRLEFKPAEIGTLEEALTSGKKARAELAAQKNREQFARMNYNATRAERLPSVGAAADYGAIGSDP